MSADHDSCTCVHNAAAEFVAGTPAHGLRVVPNLLCREACRASHTEDNDGCRQAIRSDPLRRADDCSRDVAGRAALSAAHGVGAEEFRRRSPPLAGGLIDRARLSAHFFGRTSGLGVGDSRLAIARFRLPAWQSARVPQHASTSNSRLPAVVAGSPAADRPLLAATRRLPASDPGLIPATVSFRSTAGPRQAVRSLRISFYSHLTTYARPEFSRKRLGRRFTQETTQALAPQELVITTP